jgi:hypothetical protein
VGGELQYVDVWHPHPHAPPFVEQQHAKLFAAQVN